MQLQRNEMELQRKDNELQRLKNRDAERDRQQQKKQLAETEEDRRRTQLEAKWLREGLELEAYLNFNNNSTISQLATQALSAVPLQETGPLHEENVQALVQMGDHDAALKEAQAALDDDPGNTLARLRHGYVSLLLGRGQDTLSDDQLYSQSNPASTYEHINAALALAMLRRYDQAIAETQKAIRTYQYGGESLDSEVSPDIQRATGQTVMYAAPGAYYVALHYEIAVLRAMKNGAGFARALESADRVASDYGFAPLGPGASAASISPEAASVNPYLVALNWAWLEVRAQRGKEDYGVLASYGALWDRAGQIQERFKDWAGHFYLQFEEAHRKQLDPKYDQLSAWVEGRMHELYPSGNIPPLPPEDFFDFRSVMIEAEQLQQRGKYREAGEVLTRAIPHVEKNPKARAELADLLILRSNVLFRANNYAGCAKDCKRILSINPNNAIAYKLLAYSEGGNPAAQQRDCEQALKFNPQDADALVLLSRLLADKNPEKALQLLKRSKHTIPPYAWASYDMARIQNKLGRHQEAFKSINDAIARDNDDFEFYDERAKAETGLKRSETVVNLNKASGYRLVGDTKARLGRTSDALDIYLQALQVLAPVLERSTDSQVQAEARVEIRSISRLIENTSTRESAKNFWMAAAESAYLKPYESFVKEELIGLAD